MATAALHARAHAHVTQFIELYDPLGFCYPCYTGRVGRAMAAKSLEEATE
jgi:hypothetical protein